jgi:hypothetical protein
MTTAHVKEPFGPWKTLEAGGRARSPDPSGTYPPPREPFACLQRNWKTYKHETTTEAWAKMMHMVMLTVANGHHRRRRCCCWAC